MTSRARSWTKITEFALDMYLLLFTEFAPNFRFDLILRCLFSWQNENVESQCDNLPT